MKPNRPDSIPFPEDEFPAHASKLPCAGRKFPAPTRQGIRQFDGKTLELRRELAPAGAELTGDFEKFRAEFPAGKDWSFKPAPAADRVT